jgi:hypothetical protein
MVTVHRIDHEHVRCPHCGKEVSWLWEMSYESPQLRRRLLLCSECEGLICPEKRPGPSENHPTPAAA